MDSPSFRNLVSQSAAICLTLLGLRAMCLPFNVIREVCAVSIVHVPLARHLLFRADDNRVLYHPLELWPDGAKIRMSHELVSDTVKIHVSLHFSTLPERSRRVKENRCLTFDWQSAILEK